eukprot:SAG31_NODE_24830_length_473_cov_1.245989_2_plen_118_part_01
MSPFLGPTDLFVAGQLDTEGADFDLIAETDTHWRAKNGVASFNYRFIFDLSLPRRKKDINRCRLRLSAWDKDPLKLSRTLLGTHTMDITSLCTQAAKAIAQSAAQTQRLESADLPTLQ